MLAPLAPHIAEEMWSRLGTPRSLAWTPFPVADPALLVDDTIEVPVQVNGKVRAVDRRLPAGTDDAGLMEAAARADAADRRGPGRREPSESSRCRAGSSTS